MNKPRQKSLDEESRSMPIRWIKRGDCTLIYLYGCKVKYRLIRGMPEWAVEKPSHTRVTHYEARHLPEVLGELQRAAQQGVPMAEVDILRALRLICDEVLGEHQFSTARVAADRVCFDVVNIGTPEVPLFMNIEVIQPADFNQLTHSSITPRLALVA